MNAGDIVKRLLTFLINDNLLLQINRKWCVVELIRVLSDGKSIKHLSEGGEDGAGIGNQFCWTNAICYVLAIDLVQLN